MELHALQVKVLALIHIQLVRSEWTVLLVHTARLSVITQLRCLNFLLTKWKFLSFEMPAVHAFPNGSPELDLRFAGRRDNTGHAHKLCYLVALKCTQLNRNLVRVDLHLKLRRLLHIRVLLLKNLISVDNLDRTFEDLQMVGGRIFEILSQLLVKRNQVAHVELEEVVASLGVVLELLPVDVDVVDLGLLDEMHKLDLSVGELLPLVGLEVLVNQILVAVEDLFTFKTHSC